MKIISSAVLVALFAVSNARFLDATNPAQTVAQTYGSAAFNSALNCGQCIGLGHTYCTKQAEYVTGTTYAASSPTCIQGGTSGAAMTDVTFSCSNAFTDRVYSKYVCQYNTAACGPFQYLSLSNTN